MSPREAMHVARTFLIAEGFPSGVLSKSDTFERFPNQIAHVATWLAKHPDHSQRLLLAFRRIGGAYFKLQIMLALAVLTVHDPGWPAGDLELRFEVDVRLPRLKQPLIRQYGVRRDRGIRRLDLLN